MKRRKNEVKPVPVQMDWSNPKPHPVNDLDIAFGGLAMELIPSMDKIPDEFKRGRHWAARLFSTLFFSGGSVAHLQPREGIDRVSAFRHIQAVMHSFAPKHEHKEAGCAYLFAQWFEAPRTTGEG